MNVKKFIAITTICAAMLSTGTLITASAETQDGLTIPDSFTVELTFDSVTDYAVGNGQYAFAEGNNIYVYTVNKSESSGYNYFGEVTIYEHTSAILALEYSGNKLYFSDGSTYLYSDGKATSAEFSFTSFSDSTRIDAGTYLYYINGKDLVLYNTVSTIADTHSGAVYSGLKTIGSSYYVLEDATLCNISDGVLTEMSFSYEDYTVGAISTADTAQALSEKTEVQTAVISAGTCIIRVDEDYLGNDTFAVWDWSVIFAEEDMDAQVLYMPDGGNAALVAVGTKTYLTLKENLNVSVYTAQTVTAQSYYLLDDASVYSIPFENEYTIISKADKNTVVTVTGYVSGDEFDYDYYKVEYTANGETVSGYMIADLLTAYTFANDNYDKEAIIGGDQSDDNDIFTIVLIMIIVLLVLIAIGYLVFVSTSNKKKRPKKK